MESITLQAFPTDISSQIIKLCLAGSWNGKIPNLIIALRRTQLYEEACKVMVMSNVFVLSSRNSFSVGDLKPEMLKLITKVVVEF